MVSLIENGYKAKIVPIKYLQNIEQDIEKLRKDNSLSNYSKEVVNNYFSFDIPELNFKALSVIVVASPSPLVKVSFTLDGQKRVFRIPPTYIDLKRRPIEIEEELSKFLIPKGYHVKNTSSLPRKLLAVRSGLGVYGRNNICYVEGMGSFLSIGTYYSDIPCSDIEWHELKQTDICKHCNKCINSCPTGAITNERDIINTDRCLTHYNENAQSGFPAWIDPLSHNCIVGCMKCQICCPLNMKYLKDSISSVEFSEKETAYILEGKLLEQLPQELAEKVETIGMNEYLGALPRNLRVLMNKEK